MDHSPTFSVRHNQEIVLILLSLLFIALGWVFMYLIGRFALVGAHSFQFFADSNTYHDIYSGFIGGPGDFIDVSYNFIGPMIILSMTGGNIYLIVVFNVLLFTLSMCVISRQVGINPITSSAVQLLSPLTLSSLMSVNKEILIFPVLAALLASYRHKSIGLLALAVLISLAARWQLTLFCCVVSSLYFIRGGNRYIILASLLLSVSVVYYLSMDFLAPVLERVEIYTDQYTAGSGLFERLNDIQNAGLYFLVAPLKAAHLLFSLGLRIDDIINPIIVYNDQIQGLFCLVNLLMFLSLITMRRFSVHNDLILISIVYLIVFALTPVYAPRYFHPVTVLWALALAGARGIIVPMSAMPVRSTAHA